MKIAAMFDDILRSLIHEPITQKYPRERTPAPERLRGHLEWNPERCTGCQLCTKDCPADAIHMITVDKATKHYVFEYAVDRCTFCGQCVESCRFNCLRLDHNEWELSSLTADNFTSYLGDKTDVDTLLARLASESTEKSA